MFDYDHYLAKRLRDNKIDRMYRDMMIINRLNVPYDIKYHLRHVYKMEEKECSAKWNHKRVMNELKLYAFYSWGLFNEVPGPTIYEDLDKTAFAGSGE